MSARDEVLRKVRAATADVTDADPLTDTPVDWAYGRPLGTPDVLADFAGKLADYGATVDRCPAPRGTHALIEALRRLDARTVVIPPGAPDEWAAAVTAAGMTVVTDDPELTHAQLDAADAVVTTAAVAMADSGTIALDHADGQGRRALTLLPDRHVCLVRADQVVSDVPEGLARLAPAIRAGRPVTWLSGGSATSDIELTRIEGVHGPRRLAVVLAE